MKKTSTKTKLYLRTTYPNVWKKQVNYVLKNTLLKYKEIYQLDFTQNTELSKGLSPNNL